MYDCRLCPPTCATDSLHRLPQKWLSNSNSFEKARVTVKHLCMFDSLYVTHASILCLPIMLCAHQFIHNSRLTKDMTPNAAVSIMTKWLTLSMDLSLERSQRYQESVQEKQRSWPLGRAMIKWWIRISWWERYVLATWVYRVHCDWESQLIEPPSWQFLALKGPDQDGSPKVESMEHCEKFWLWLESMGISSHRSAIVKAIALRVNEFLPGVYDPDLYDY